MSERCGHEEALDIFPMGSGKGWAEFGLAWRPELMALSNSNVPASAPIISLMESACERAVWSALRNPLSSVALSLRVDHFRPATGGRQLIAWAECFRVSKRIAFVRGIAHDGDENDPVANMSGSFFYRSAS